MTTRILRPCFALVLTAILVAPPVSAFDYPLSSTAIREAYFLGSGDPDKRALYVEKYAKRYPIPKSGEYVGLVSFETPYVIIAEEVAQKGDDYHAPDAVQDYLGKPAVCRVRVEVYWGFNSTSAITNRPNRSQVDYTVRVKQNGKEIPVKSKWTESLVTSASAPIDVGIAFNSEYDAENVDSGNDATVEVVEPDGTTLAETFDLASVR